MKPIAFILMLAWLLLGAANNGCSAPVNVEYDLYAPRPYPDQPVMRYYRIYLNGEPYGHVLYQGHFATGLRPSQNIQLCWSSCGITTRDPAYCPAEVPPVETPCLLGCDNYDDYIECFQPTWFALGVKRGGQNDRGGPRQDALTGDSRGYR